MRLLFADAIASLQRREPGPDEPHAVMFLMDEFDQLGRQPLVLSSIKTIRSFGGRFFIISQTIPGLDDIYGETGRRSLQGGAGVQIYMTPQDDRTADVLSNALGRSTVTAVTESQSRVRALEDSANVSRRSEERPLISANELLRFPLDEVLVLPEGQYPIRARHIRYYEDRHFGPIDRARSSVGVAKILEFAAGEAAGSAVRLSNLAGPAPETAGIAERLPEATAGFPEIAKAAKAKRRLPERARSGDARVARKSPNRPGAPKECLASNVNFAPPSGRWRLSSGVPEAAVRASAARVDRTLIHLVSHRCPIHDPPCASARTISFDKRVDEGAHLGARQLGRGVQCPGLDLAVRHHPPFPEPPLRQVLFDQPPRQQGSAGAASRGLVDDHHR